MKKKSLLKQSILLATLSLSAACFSPALPFVGENHVLVAEAAKPVKLNVAKKTYLIKGKTKTLKLLNTKNKVSWSSSKRAVATINSKGVVKARKTGATTITATCKGKKYKCTIIVEAPKLSNTKLSLTVGQSRKIALKATKQKVKWVSAKSSIASVNSKGVITAKKPGTVKIAAKIGTGKYYCKVTVKKATSIPETPTTEAPTTETPVVKVQSITLDKTSVELTDTETVQLVATITPSNAANQDINWSSSDTNVVTVDNTGKIQAIAPGTATITASTADGGYSVTCQVTTKRSKEATYKALKDFVIKNGSNTDDGTKEYGWSNFTSDAKLSWSIVYDPTDDSLILNSAQTLTSSESVSAVAMALDPDKDSALTTVVVFAFPTLSSSFTAITDVNSSSYNKYTNRAFSISDTKGVFTSSKMFKNAQNISNECLQLAFSGWKVLFNDKIGIRMSELGFIY